ncbi:hypothetical protein [Staphylococcus arlettae]|uniref:hypothetical protein n=1 Tax=Staphylococcus arlettae TaxID=29378 RepID=UPI0021CF9EC2|nr:hypothetical protein [Staphylococcus arlettae]UXU51832.1 hypothetical protein MUA71_09795 [Staphylococcus arlettae]
MKRVRDKHNEVCFEIVDKEKIALVPVEDYKEAKALGIHNRTIISYTNDSIAGLRRYMANCERKEGIERLNREDRERKERKQQLLLEKQRKEQERLQMIENAKIRSKWFEHLATNNIFPKVVR